MVATRAVIGTAGPPCTATSASGCATRLRNQAGERSSPPLDATITSAAPSRTGEVNSTVRRCPVFRPVVVSSSIGIRSAVHPTRPKLTLSIARWTAFMVFRVKAEGIS